VDDHNHFNEFLRVLDASTGVQGKHFVVCKQLCHSSARYIISMESKICILSIKLHKHDALREN
jgi:hypothetical protein